MKEILDKCGFLRGLGTEKLNLTGLLTPFGGEAISEQLKTQESQGVQKQGRNHRGGRPDAGVADGIVIVRAGWYNTENHEKGSNHTQKYSVQHGLCHKNNLSRGEDITVRQHGLSSNPFGRHVRVCFSVAQDEEQDKDKWLSYQTAKQEADAEGETNFEVASDDNVSVKVANPIHERE